MKKIVISTTIILQCTSMFAQTLNQSTHAPAIGDSCTYRNADPATLPSNLGNPGSGNVFNFSGLSVLPGTKTRQGVTVASTGSASAYPSANVAVKTGTNYLFFNSQSNKLEFYGGDMNIGYNVVLNYSSPSVLGIYPMNLGTTHTSTVAGTINGSSGVFTGVTSFTADATGSLIVPGGITYNNIMRVQTNQVLTYTLGATVMGTLNVIQFDYYAPSYSNFPNPNNNWPLISVQQFTLSSNINPTTTNTNVIINSNYQTLSTELINTPPISSFITPNPAHDQIKLNSKNLKYVQVLDISGKILHETNNNIIQTNHLANGVYFLRWVDKNGNVKTEKFIVNHD